MRALEETTNLFETIFTSSIVVEKYINSELIMLINPLASIDEFIRNQPPPISSLLSPSILPSLLFSSFLDSFVSYLLVFFFTNCDLSFSSKIISPCSLSLSIYLSFSFSLFTHLWINIIFHLCHCRVFSSSVHSFALQLITPYFSSLSILI